MLFEFASFSPPYYGVCSGRFVTTFSFLMWLPSPGCKAQILAGCIGVTILPNPRPFSSWRDRVISISRQPDQFWNTPNVFFFLLHSCCLHVLYPPEWLNGYGTRTRVWSWRPFFRLGGKMKTSVRQIFHICSRVPGGLINLQSFTMMMMRFNAPTQHTRRGGL